MEHLTVPPGGGDKLSWRCAVLVRRRRMSAQERSEGDRARNAHLRHLIRTSTGGSSQAPGEDCVVAAYDAFGSEPDPTALITPGWLLPVLREDNDLGWFAHPGGWDMGLDVIEQADVLLVPALAVDRNGIRLGRGGGSYDRALARARGLIVALLHEGELVDTLPAQPHDVGVHAVALPSGIVTLRDRR